MKKRIYQFVFHRLMGWEIIGTIDPRVKKCVMMVIPHTSWHDFYIGLFSRGIIGLQMHWVGKKELFRFPFGAYFRWMGGAPLDRSGGLNKVDSIAAIFEKRAVFRMAISPEGTRKKVNELKTGYYYIALKLAFRLFRSHLITAKNKSGSANHFIRPVIMTAIWESCFRSLKVQSERFPSTVLKFNFSLKTTSNFHSYIEPVANASFVKLILCLFYWFGSLRTFLVGGFLFDVVSPLG